MSLPESARDGTRKRPEPCPENAALHEPRFFLASSERLTIAPADQGRRLDLILRGGADARKSSIRLPPGILVLDAVVARVPDGSEAVVTADFDVARRRGEVSHWLEPLAALSTPARRRVLFRGQAESVFRSLLVWGSSLLVLDVRHRVVHRLLDADGDGLWEEPADAFADAALLDGLEPGELQYVAGPRRERDRRVLLLGRAAPGAARGDVAPPAHVLVDADGDGVAELVRRARRDE